MTDDIDRAQAREAELLADALRDHARRAGRGWGAVSAEDCGGCGEVIPVARRRAAPCGAGCAVVCGVPGVPGAPGEDGGTMTLQIDFWQLLGLLLSGLGALWGVVKMAAAQAQRHQDAAHAQLVGRLDAIEQASRTEAGNWQRVEREILQLKADLPLNYVRREDYVQSTATIMAKLDAISLRFENVLLQRGKNHE